MADTNVTIQAQDTTFNRSASTTQLITYTAYNYPVLNPFTPVQYSVVKPAFTPSSRVGTLVPSITARIGPTDLTTKVTTRVGPADLSALLMSAAGLSDLAEIYGLGPFDTTYETNTQALYDRTYLTARAAALSGPQNVRGGTARQGFELADLDTQQSINRFKEIWSNQVAWAGVVIQAISTANTAIFEYNRELVQTYKTSNDIIGDYDKEYILATQTSNAISEARDKQLMTATVAYNGVLAEYDKELLSDNEESIMAQHSNATAANGYYNVLSANNDTLIKSYSAGRHYGQVQMVTLENSSGRGGGNTGTQTSFGAWR